MKGSAIPFVIGGVALLALSGKKKKKKRVKKVEVPSEYGLEEEEELPEGGFATMPAPKGNEVVFSLEFDKYKAGVQWRYTILQSFLEKKRKSGELLTRADMSSWWYETFIRDPSRFIGELTGLGSNVGFGIYVGLWLIATGGLAAIQAGAVAGTSAAAAGPAAAGPVTKAALGTLGTSFVGAEVGFGFGTLGKIVDAVQGYSARGTIEESEYKSLMDDVGKRFSLWVEYPEAGASALEVFAEFAKKNRVFVGPAKEPMLISDLPPSDATAHFLHMIMSLIHRYQSSVFEG